MGTQSSIHIHVWAAVILGAIIVSIPIGFGLFASGKPLTRHLIAIGQMLMSALLIHLSGGRIETHFHVFGSLAFIGFYRDWRVLTTASVVVAVDHFFRGVYWPESVYGILVPEPYRWLEHTAWVVFEDVFLLIASFGSLKEMYQIAENEVHLQKAIQGRDTFLSICGHELKTPLTSLKLQLDMSQRSLNKMEPTATLSIEKAKTLIHSLNDQVDKLARLVADVLDTSRLHVGRFTIHKKEMDLEVLAGEVVQKLSPYIEEGHSHVEFKSNGQVLGFWDPDRVEQVLINLLTNALKFSDGKPIQLAIEKTDTVARVSVTDYGIGIAPENQERIFDRFEQVQTNGNRSGLGLGLYIVRNIMQAHKGTIRVISELGKGATFVAELPL